MSETGKSNIEDQKVMEAYKADLTLKAQKELETHKAELAARDNSRGSVPSWR